VREARHAKTAVQKVLERFGRLDVLITNAGFISVLGKRKEKIHLRLTFVWHFYELIFHCVYSPALDKKDPDAWWNAFEVNIRGVFNFVWCVRTAAGYRPISHL
jgi:NADP-dependent 3-hydroxy acid dehydrogenase YdfG